MMMDKEIKIPKYLHELHGEKTKLSSLIMVYLCALLVGGLVLSQIIPLALPLWKTILAVIIFMDIGGGVVANLTSATNQYYQNHSNLRIPFLFLHIFHPLALLLIFPKNLLFLGLVLLFTLASSIGVNVLRNSELQQTLAALLVAVGVCLTFLAPVSPAFLFVFSPLFMVKLILGFSVRRPDFS
jgi:hypothetical protein